MMKERQNASNALKSPRGEGTLFEKRKRRIPRDFTAYIILDLEWNQVSVWKRTGDEHLPENGEIIEIGAVRVSPEGKKLDCFKSLVKPVYFQKMHRQVEQITGITISALQSAPTFPEAFQRFMDFCGEEKVAILTWGMDDMPMLRENMQIYGIDEGVLPYAFDLQQLFGRQVVGEEKQWSLSDAVEYFSLPMSLNAHDALNDALYTAMVAEKMGPRAAIENMNEEEIILERHSVSGGKKWMSLFLENRIAAFQCPFCGKAGSIEFEDWRVRSGTARIAPYRCACGVDCFLVCRIRKRKNGVLSAVRTAYLMNEAAEKELSEAVSQSQTTAAPFRGQARFRKKDAPLSSARRVKSPGPEEGE